MLTLNMIAGYSKVSATLYLDTLGTYDMIFWCIVQANLE